MSDAYSDFTEFESAKMLAYDSNAFKTPDTPVSQCEQERDGTDAFNFGTDDKNGFLEVEYSGDNFFGSKLEDRCSRQGDVFSGDWQLRKLVVTSPARNKANPNANTGHH